MKRAVEKGLVSVMLIDFRKFADDKHHTVDDYPYGGDPGMLIMAQPISRAVQASKARLLPMAPKVVFMSPQGRLLTHEVALELSREQALILICGHYKGIDQRVIDRYADWEISIGDYIVSGGELPAMVLTDAVTRLIPGVLGNSESAQRDSLFNGLLSPPQYTRPEEFEHVKVPEVLLSGHHQRIRQWQHGQALEITKRKRPDLWEEYCKNHPEES